MEKDNNTNKDKPEVHEELKGFEIKIDELGNVISSIEKEDLNKFLDENVEDRKLKERDEKEDS